MKKMSLATRRAIERNYHKDSEWYCQFKYRPVEGLGYEEGVHRRDPSSIIQVGGTYFVWYTRSEGPSVGYGTGDLNAKVWPWDWSEIWYATSEDGIHWTEWGIAVSRGERGSYDDRSVFTPEILAHDGKILFSLSSGEAPVCQKIKRTNRSCCK